MLRRVPDQGAFRSNDAAAPRECDETHAIGAERRTDEGDARACDEMHTGDRAIAELAARQRGVVTTAQLDAAGIGRRGVAHRVAHGRLTRVLRGVYRVGPVEAPFAREMAAVLATGGVLSHHSAAMVWGLRPLHDGPVHVTVRTGTRNRAGVRTHRSPSLNAAVHQGLPLTTAARTLNDLAPALRPAELDRAVEEAQIRGLVTARELRGRAAAASAEPQLTRSEAERRLLKLIERARLPRPATNVRVAGWEVDALWPPERLIVEVDGYAYHGNRAAFERDRRKDAALVAAGYTVIRVTWRQLEDEPLAVVALLARLIRRG
jgi:very-short-patch-repair endonuclease